MSPAFTIIIPHKDIPRLLERCLNSIPQREDVQIIVIDDCSDPAIVDFENLPMAGRPGLEYILNKIPLGAGHARNLGLERAEGKWLLFADADDCFNPCLNEMLDKYLMCDTDMVVFNADSIFLDSGKPSKRTAYLNRFHKIYARNPEKGIELMRRVFGEPWAKMVKSDLIKKFNIRFDETPTYNDMGFSARVGVYAESVVADSALIYCVTDRQGSLSKTASEERTLLFMKLRGRQEVFYRNNGITRNIPQDHYHTLLPFMLRLSPMFSRCCAELQAAGLGRIHIWFRMSVAAIQESYQYPARVAKRIFRNN